MKKRLLVSLLLLGSEVCSAQTDFRPGYVVPVAGDTIKGEIDYRGERLNSRVCRFRATETITEYKPEQLHGYGLANGPHFHTVTLPLPKAAKDLSGAADIVAQPVFVEMLVQGQVSLLFLHDRRDVVRYYVQVGQQPPKQLIQRVEDVEVNGRTMRRQSDEFRRTLAEVTASCLAVQPEIAQAKLAVASLVNVVKHYNECVGAPALVPVVKERKTIVRFGLIGGIQRGKQDVFSGLRVGQLIFSDTDQNTQFGVGVTLSNIVGLNRNLGARFEVQYGAQQFRKTTPGNGTIIDTRELVFPVLLRYAYPKGYVRPYIQGGMVPRWLVKHTSDFEYFPRSLELGLGGSVGLLLGKKDSRQLGIELRMERTNGTVDPGRSRLYYSKQLRTLLLVSYDLTK